MKELELDSTIELPPLPEGWRYATVAEVGASSEQAVLTGPFGTNLGRSDFVDRGVPLLTISCLTDQGIKRDKALFVSEEKAEELERYRLREGDILFSRMASVGRAGIVGKQLEGALFNYHIMRLRLEPTRVEPKFFAAYVRGAAQVRDYLKAVNHGATLDGINTSQLMNMPVAVAPISEQRDIVAEIEKQFSRLDEAVANLKRVKANLKRYKAAVLKAAVEGRLVPTEAVLARREDRSYETGAQLLQRILETRRSQWKGKGKYREPAATDTTDRPALPEGWVWSTMPQLGELNRGKSKHRPRDDPRLYGGPYPFIQTGDVRRSEGSITEHGQTYSELGLQQSRLWPAGTLCITIAANIAETGILKFPACFPDSVVGFAANGGVVTTQYVDYFIRTARDKLDWFASGKCPVIPIVS